MEISTPPTDAFAAPRLPVRHVERNKSGPGLMRRSAPRRSQSHRIGRPAFKKEPPPTDSIPQAVNRSSSNRFTRAAPLRTGSFQKSAPDRAHSTSALKAYRRHQQSTPLGQQISVPYSGGDDDSVFTTASSQTLDSIMLRKKQMPNQEGIIIPGPTGRRSRASMPQPSFEFDESLHTVDSLNVHMKHFNQSDEGCDYSVFSESFASSDTYALSDYEEDGDLNDDDDVIEEDLDEM